jgi:hypothetical protein
MQIPKHLRLLGIVTIAWILFLIGGLPHYYQQYSTKFMILFDIAILPPTWFVVYYSAKKAKPDNGLKVTLWLSFYISVPLFFYDLIYCGIYLGNGIIFIWKYWYLTAYYILPWIFFPVTGWLVDKKR